MQAALFFALFYLAAGVWAGGYAGALERVLLYQAYLIDGLNPESERTVGFSCTKFQETTKTCTGNWKPCKPVNKNNPNGRCSYDDLIHSMGKASTPLGWSVFEDGTTKLDTEATAKNTYRMYLDSRGNVPNFQPYKAMLHADGEFNKYIVQLGNVVNTTWKKKTTDDHDQLWKDFDSTREKVNIARAADHGRHLIDAADAALGSHMEVKRQALGTDPISGDHWETVDWKETALAARNAGVADAPKRIQGFLRVFYGISPNMGPPSAARKHQQVIKSYQQVANKSLSCRPA